MSSCFDCRGDKDSNWEGPCDSTSGWFESPCQCRTEIRARRINRILFESSCFCAAFVAVSSLAHCKSTGGGLIKQAEHISATPPLNGFCAPEVTAAVCRRISHSHVACFLAMFFRNQSPLMSFGASFVSFLVSNEVCVYFPFMVWALTKMTLKHLYHAEVKGFPRLLVSCGAGATDLLDATMN